MRTTFQTLLGTITLILTIFLLAACSDDSSEAGKHQGSRGGKNKATKPVPVELATASVGQAYSLYVTTATLTASSDAKINSRTAGVIREILHEEGDDIKANEVLLLLENDDQKLRLKQAKLKLANAEWEYKRLNKMQQAGAISANEWETSRSNYLTAKTEVELAELALSYTEITAPFDGRLVWREVDLGAYVSSGDLLFRMMSIRPLLLKVHVPANRLEQVEIGQTVTLNIDSIAQEIEASVSLISPIVDPQTGTVKVTVRLDDYPEGVRPGDFTEVRMITNRRKNALMVPTVAIIEERGQHYLYVEADNKASRRNIEVGYVMGDSTEVLSGISADDRLVVKGQRNLNEGNPLKVMNAEQDTATVPELAEKAMK